MGWSGDFTEAMNITTQLVFIRGGLMGWHKMGWPPPPRPVCVFGVVGRYGGGGVEGGDYCTTWFTPLLSQLRYSNWAFNTSPLSYISFTLNFMNIVKWANLSKNIIQITFRNQEYLFSFMQLVWHVYAGVPA